jgi:hypothetical protein
VNDTQSTQQTHTTLSHTTTLSQNAGTTTGTHARVGSRAGFTAAIAAVVVLFVIVTAATLKVMDSDRTEDGARHQLSAVTPTEPSAQTQAGIDRIAARAEAAQAAAMAAAVAQQQATAAAAIDTQNQTQAGSLGQLSDGSAASKLQFDAAQSQAAADTAREQSLVRAQAEATAAAQSQSAAAVAAQGQSQSQAAASASAAAATQRLASCLQTAVSKWGSVGLSGSLGQQQDEAGCLTRFGAVTGP